ncbi:DNA-binding SARP family transcriptional activator/tetratricopeptide (TPR) repeat protein [Saccharothrix tamanrassetensis]|uniref:DNA-binding SARP family transcriptional activator/tetratricopeptide (TPR) repeat protein n=1 Tax=Saccharothrix tamanrassetensis TaxID=1051531 RepID=A0A841CWN5_9PSEU|nr:BTAD domain-containing putative transcriptional regulator [Saccharothrix tamanrassetensis]MBB5959776.1 DNA-binding SARP family transcriptional activator/tetratricopeptide (TPR) repeat protein [Saccharothrix tamanrassetensis]
MAASSSAVHRTIVVVGVEGFGDPHRTLPHQLGTREGLYRVVDRALRAVGVRWRDCYHEDRGDSVFVLVPPEVSKGPLVEVVPEALARSLREHNVTVPPEQHVRLRVAVHAGEVAFDDHGVTSTALTTAFRLLGAPALGQALAGSPGTVALIVSRWIFDEVVRHSAVLDATTFRPVPVAVKETRGTAWIALPDQPYPADPAVLDHRVDVGHPEAGSDGLEFGVLGPVAVRHRGRELVVGSAQQRCVLALLLLDAGRVVSLERLVDALWRDDAVPRTARNVVQRCVSDLRKLLAVDPQVRLAHKPPGYLLEVRPERVDLHRFRSLVGQARGAADRAVSLRRALELWRGEPLADVDGLESVRQALAEERSAVLEDCLEAEVDSGRHAQAVPELRGLVSDHPLRERPTGLLMLALYRGGRQAEALEHYRHTRQRLAGELGTDPGPALRRLHHRILTADPTLAATPADVAPPAKVTHPPAQVPHQLPTAPAPFVGRRDELARLDSTVAAADGASTVLISAIGGAGGIGKSWLALHWAHRHADRFPDGQLFVDLRGFSPDSEPMNPAVAVRGFLDALGVAQDRIPVEAHAQTALFRSLASGRRMLVVLDNAVDTTQVAPLLPGGTTCAVLVTSRNHLPGLVTGHGARHLSLDVLPEADARALLTDRLGAARIAAEPTAVRELVDLCDGYPLALGIVAAHAHMRPRLPLAALADELRELGLEALDDDDPAASLPTILSWSYRNLAPDQATAFALLGIAPGRDIGPHAAASLFGLPGDTTRAVLRGLEQASLVSQHARGRYRMHDLIRRQAVTTAHEHLTAEARETGLRRVMSHYLHTAHAAACLLNPHAEKIPLAPPTPGSRPHPPADDPAAMAWFDTEHANLLAAQRTADTHRWYQPVWDLAWTLLTFHVRRAHRHDDLAVWQAALDATKHLPEPGTRIRAHRFLGRAFARLGRHEESARHLHQALALADRHHLPLHQAHTHQVLSLAAEAQGDDRRALDHATRALEFYRALDLPVWQADALNAVGWFATRLGDHDTAREHCHAALVLHRRHHNTAGEASTLDSLGLVDHRTGRHAEAAHHYEQALALFRDLNNTSQAADTLDHLGHPYVALGRHEKARAVWREALELFRRQSRDDEAERVQRQLDALGQVDGDEPAGP